MIARPLHALVRNASALAVVLALAGCTQGGQFDPTEVLAADPFGTKKKLQGEREPLFPSGVPGAETGVPHDLVKGYQPPPEQTAAEESVGSTKPAAAAAEANRNQNRNPSRRSRAHPRQHRRGRTPPGARVRRLRRRSGTTRPGIRNPRLRSSRSGRLPSRRLRPSKRRSRRNRSGPILRRPIRLRVDHFG